MTNYADLIKRLRAFHEQYVERADMGTVFEEAADALEALMAEALRIKEARLTELTDEEAGRWLKRFARKMDEAWKGVAEAKDWNEADLMISRAMHQALDWVKTCISTNAETMTYTLRETTIANKPAGDWEIQVTRLPPPPKDGDG